MSRKFEFGPNQLAWMAALESGEHKQVTRMLSCAGGMCCLGVAAKHVLQVGVDTLVPEDSQWPELDNEDYTGEYIELLDAEETVLSSDAMEKLGLYSENGEISSEYHSSNKDLRRFLSLTHMNDSGKTFAEIAAFMRENPKAAFKHPA